jgi:transcriptional regulatory protein LevR/transcriptional regulator with AAA-type ATPase domain
VNLLKKLDMVLEYINKKFSEEYILNSIKSNDPIGVDAIEIQQNIGIVRNNASTILNTLWKSSKLVKINSRPVTFLPKNIIERLNISNSQGLKDTYTREEIKEAIHFTQKNDNRNDPFQHLLGSNNSLFNQIGQAKAAIVYPPKGLHTLILGESGVGKTTFAYTMYEYGLLSKGLTKNTFPFISFNCSDYFNNPQLLLSQLFGHSKGAFTGADSDKVGLVEQANGGILFLDEIHRLPPDGQEMFFYLMDKGEYHRLGETGTKRKTNVLIIAATTEEPNGVLLSTFLRRIPVIVTLPSFREKDISEKIELIENFFYCESVNLNMRIIISPEVLKALVLYDFKGGNIGQLRSEIRLLCAKSFLQYLQNSQEIMIDFKMLDKEIREYVFVNTNINSTVKLYMDMFSENLIITPSDDKGYHYPSNPNNDIYDLIIKKIDTLKNQGLSKDTINLKISTEIENHFQEVMNNFNSNRLNIHQLYKLVSKEIVDASIELINIAQKILSTKFNNKFIFGLAFHIQALLKRISEEKPIKNPNMITIKKEYPKEFKAAKELVTRLNEKFGLLIPEDEKGFLAILLSNNKLNTKSEDKIGIIVVCHGNATASSMANVANTLLNSDLVKAIDMPLDADIAQTYNKIKATAVASNKDKGILLLVDMGSLLNSADQLMNEIGIKIKTIDNVSTLLVIEALRNILYKNDDLETIYNFLINKDAKPIPSHPAKKKAILTVCVTGQGSSMIAKNVLSKILYEKYNEKFEIIATNYIDAKNIFEDIARRYDVVAIIGSIKPEINIPYFPMNKLFDEQFQKEFLKFIDSNINYQTAITTTGKSAFEISKEMLEQYVKYINPKLAIVAIKKFLNSINYKNELQDDLIDLIVHMGCMLDRCIHKDVVRFENVNSFKEKHLEQFNSIRNAANILEEEYCITINDDEICYIIVIINR